MSEGSEAEMPKMFSVEEVAQMLNVSDRTIRRLCQREEIPHIYIGSQIRITENDLQNYLSNNKKGEFKNDTEC